MMNALSKKAGSRRAFSSGYKKGWAMKKKMPYPILAESKARGQKLRRGAEPSKPHLFLGSPPRAKLHIHQRTLGKYKHASAFSHVGRTTTLGIFRRASCGGACVSAICSTAVECRRKPRDGVRQSHKR
jgi:hypothetical protein